MKSSKISDRIRLPISLLAAVVLTICVGSKALAESADEFKKNIDTRMSLEFLKVKSEKKLSEKNKELALYKVIDVQQSNGEIIPETGDVVELVCPKGEDANGKGLPWAEVNPDGMIKMQIPKTYMRKRAKSSAKTFWRIDNEDNKFALIKPKTKS